MDVHPRPDGSQAIVSRTNAPAARRAVRDGVGHQFADKQDCHLGSTGTRQARSIRDHRAGRRRGGQAAIGGVGTGPDTGRGGVGHVVGGWDGSAPSGSWAFLSGPGVARCMTNIHATCTDRHRSADGYQIPAGEGMFPRVTRVIASPVRAGRPHEDGRATWVIHLPFCG